MLDEVYVKLPSICGDDPDMVRYLLHALYGHPRAGQLWNDNFIQFMLGACESKSYLNKFWRKLAAKFKLY